ncbi:hypothetical protein QBC35DRAFT_510127 [Podospora australis]|uniref:Uncharacterized protein n=1 Tax=Podospora australis TaxID=1536484 RepID=A0AAN6WJ42_9PEZI|nr:hypothetical protein QBC35DRAFT_510127 [Podospora australis]
MGQTPPPGYKHLLRKKYSDPKKLLKYLNEVYPGPGCWSVEVKDTRVFVYFPDELSKEEVERIEHGVKVHYNK